MDILHIFITRVLPHLQIYFIFVTTRWTCISFSKNPKSTRRRFSSLLVIQTQGTDWVALSHRPRQLSLCSPRVLLLLTRARCKKRLRLNGVTLACLCNFATADRTVVTPHWHSSYSLKCYVASVSLPRSFCRLFLFLISYEIARCDM